MSEENENQKSPGPPADLPSLEPATISAEELHRETAFAAAFENGWRLRMAYRLLAIKNTKLHNELGSSSPEQYGEQQYHRPYHEVQAMIRVAEALKDLPKLREIYLMGRLGWFCLELLCQVATSETEEEWISFALKRPVRVIKMEVDDALEKKRKVPRKDRYGLPDAKVNLTFRLRHSQYEIVNQGMGKVSREMEVRLGGQKPRPEEVLTLMSQRFLETDPEGQLPGRKEKEESLFTILYHLCPPCREARRPAVMMTGNGPVEVPVELVEAVEGEAHKETITPEEEGLPPPTGKDGNDGNDGKDGGGQKDGNGTGSPPTIDRPNPPWLIRKLKLRAGGVCQNPFCGRKIALQGDHLVERSKGGPTALSNEELFCAWCHGLRTQKIFEVRGNPVTGMEFITPADRIAVSLDPELRKLGQVPLVMVSPVTAAAPPSGSIGSGGSSGSGVKVARTGDASDDGLVRLAGGLEGLGHKKREAREALWKAREVLEKLGKSLTAENLLTAALQILHPRRPGPLRAPG